MAKVKLTDETRKKFNQNLRDLAETRDELEKAKSAGVTEIDPIIEKCDECSMRIKRLKEVYFPGKV